MSWWKQLLQGLWRRNEIHNEIDEELQFHVEMRIKDNIALGMTEKQAKANALKRFGNMQKVKSNCREVLGVEMIENLIQDFRYGLRMLLATPSFTIVTLLALALGIGATSAIFSMVNTVVLKPLPFKSQEELVLIWETNPLSGHDQVEVSYQNFLDWQKQNQVFDQIAILPSVNFDWTMKGKEEPQQVTGIFVSANFFSLLGSKPILGRDFTPEDEKQGASSVAIISYGLWQRQFGSDSNVIGQKLLLEGDSVNIIGVMPQAFDFPSGVEIWVPLISTPGDWTQKREFRVSRAIARIKSGVSLANAQSDMNRVAQGLEQEYPEANKGCGVRLIPLTNVIFGSDKPALLAMLGAVGLVLLITCANVANLLLARAGSRQREFAIRVALGAGQIRLIRQLLTESLLLALVGGTIGLFIAFIGIKVLVALAPVDIPRINDVTLDGQVIAFTFAISLLTAVLFGLIPAFQAARVSVNEFLKESGSRLFGNIHANYLRNCLVIVEVAFAVILMVGAGLMVRSFNKLQNVDAGFNPKNVLTLRVALNQSKYTDKNSYRQFFRQLNQKVKELPGIESSGAVLMRPLSGTVGWDYPFTVQGQTLAEHKTNPPSNFETASPNYFQTMGIPILKGRDFTDDDKEDTAFVAIVGESFAKKYWPNQDPIGKSIKIGAPDEARFPWMTVVGVVKDGRYREWEATRMDLYMPFPQHPQYRMDFVLKTKGNPLALVKDFNNAVYEIDKDQAISAITTMEELVAGTLSRSRYNMFLFSLFAFLALALSMVGVYGVLSYIVSQRTQEIGLRIALGASEKDILTLVLGQGLKVVSIGILLGLVVAWGFSHLLSSLLYQVTTTDPITYLLIPIGLMLIAFIACYLPAQRAIKVDPLVALRCD